MLMGQGTRAHKTAGNTENGSETQTYRRIYKILKLCEGVKQRKEIVIEANAQVEYSFKNSDLGLSEGCLRLAVECSTGQRILDFNFENVNKVK